MAKLTIPERYRVGLSKIRELDQETVQSIKTALDRSLTSGSDSEVRLPSLPSELPTAAISSLPPDKLDLRQVIEAIAGLYTAKSDRDLSVEDFADQVCDAMQRLESDQLRLPSPDREQFRQKLIALLSADGFTVLTKAVDLAMDDERTFCHARILTDLRPVFGVDVEEGPKGMVVVHLLKIDYHHGSKEHHQFQLSLDAANLQALRKLIDRAELKARSLRSVVGGVRLFGVPKEQK